MDETEYHQLPAAAADSVGRAPEKKEDSCLAIITAALPWLVVLCGIAANVYLFMVGMDTTPDPRLYVRLVAVEGLGAADPCEPPLFELAVDVDRMTRGGLSPRAPPCREAGTRCCGCRTEA
jgi:hypothetical protein